MSLTEIFTRFLCFDREEEEKNFQLFSPPSCTLKTPKPTPATEMDTSLAKDLSEHQQTEQHNEQHNEQQSDKPEASEKCEAPSDEGGSSVGLRKRERHLDDEEKVFSHNAWDDVEWDEEQEQKALAAVDKNSKHPVSLSDKGHFFYFFYFLFFDTF